MGQLDGSVAIITGASTGIGKGIAIAFAHEGASLVLAARTRSTLDEAARDVAASGAEVQAVPTDVTDERQVAALFEAAVERFGRVDILVNNAGVFDGGPVDELDPAVWRMVVEVNLTAPFLCTREAMRIMKTQGSGRILNIGSISSNMPRMNSAAYTATKHGLVGLTKSTALEGRAFGVSASCLNPGNTLTEWRADATAAMNSEPMMGTADFARVVVMAAALPGHINMLDVTVLPVEQPYLGRG